MFSTPLSLGEGLGVRCLDNSYIKNNYFAVSPKKKSPWIGALLSGLLPGAGEFYGKNYLKAGIFLGAEVLAWGTFAYFQSKGNKKTDDFEAYAGFAPSFNNWNVRQYAEWLKDEWNAGIDPEDADLEHLRATINAFESSHFSHQLPEYGEQQYFEVIGKYQNYVAGWKDAKDANGNWIVTKNNFETKHTVMFDFYAGERQRANDFYNVATDAAIVVLVNHILSAADAAWTVSMYNKKFEVQTGFEIKRYHSPFTARTGNLPSFNFRVSF